MQYGVITRVLPCGKMYYYLVFDYRWAYRWSNAVEDIEVRLHEPVLGNWSASRKTALMDLDTIDGIEPGDIAREVAYGMVSEIEKRIMERQ